jgi:paraquat-inducible protein B
MKRQGLLVGGFVLLALALAVVGVLWVGGSGLFVRQSPAVIYLTGNANGLNVGAPVTFRGVPVGRVERISIEVQRQTLDALVEVRLLLRPEAVNFGAGDSGEPLSMALLVQRGLRAQLALQSLVTGQRQVELDFLPATPAVLRGNGAVAEIPALPDRFGAIVQQVAELPLRETVQELRNTLVAIDQALAGSYRSLQATSRQLDLTLTETRKTLDIASRSMVALQARADSTLAAVTQLSHSGTDTLAAARPELQRILSSARDATELARQSLQQVSEMTAVGSAPREDLDASLRDLSQAARGLREYVELLEEQPNAVIFGHRRP